MSFITHPIYYRAAQVCSLLLLPGIFLFMVFVEVEDRIVVNGVVEADQQVLLTSPLKETLVEAILVRPGERVEKDQPLLQLADLQDWRSQAESMTKRLEFLEAQAQSQESLHAKGATAALTAREYRLKAETLRLDLQRLRRRIDRLTLTAPFTGKITGIPAEINQPTSIGTPLLALSDEQRKVITCRIPEERFAALETGQAVAIKSNLLNYLRYDIYRGTIRHFDGYGRETGERSPSYETTVELNPAAAQALKIGTTARCEIIVSRCPLYLLLLGKHRIGQSTPQVAAQD